MELGKYTTGVMGSNYCFFRVMGSHYSFYGVMGSHNRFYGIIGEFYCVTGRLLLLPAAVPWTVTTASTLS